MILAMQYKPLHEFFPMDKNQDNQPDIPIKNFDSWNEQKKVVDKRSNDLFFRRREIWWCHMGLNVGYEQDGKGIEFERPVLVLRKLGKNTFIGIPITTKIKDTFIHKSFLLPSGELRVAIIGQIRTFDTRRLTEYLDILDPSEFFPIVKAVQNLIEPLTISFPEKSSETASLEFLPKADTWSLYQEWVDWQQRFPQE